MSEEKKDLTQEELGTATEDKRQVVVAGPDTFGMYYLKLDGGGNMPKEFDNCKWTEIKEAQLVADKLNQDRG